MNVILTQRVEQKEEELESEMDEDEEVVQPLEGLGGQRRPKKGYLESRERSVKMCCEKEFQKS